MKQPLSDIRHILSSELGRVLSRGASIGFSLNVLAAGLGFIVSMLFAQAMGVEQYGVYVLVLSGLQLLHMLSLFGMDTTIVRFAAAYRMQNNWAKLRGLMRFASQLVLALSLAFLLFAVLSKKFFGVSQFGGFYQTVLIGFLLLPIWGLLSVKESALRARRLIGVSQMGSALIQPLLVCSLVLLWSFLLKQPLRASTGLCLLLGSFLFALLFAEFWYRRSYPELAQVKEVEKSLKEWISFGLPVAATLGFFVLIKYTDTLMLGYLRSPAAAGVYSAASKISELSSFGHTAVNLILAPVISELYSSQQREELQRMLTLGVSGSLVFAVIVAVFLFAFGESLLGLYGEEFKESNTALRVLLLGHVVSAGLGAVGYIVTMTGHQLLACKVVGITALVNIVFNALLIPVWGAFGAALATCLSMMFWSMTLWGQIQKRLQVDSSILSLFRSESL